MMQTLAAAWEVRAGLIPGQPIEELGKKFFYTSSDKDEDASHSKDIGYQPLFMKQMACASAYHQQMSDPRFNNWAELTFIWY
jgi:hypothetical protein